MNRVTAVLLCLSLQGCVTYHVREQVPGTEPRTTSGMKPGTEILKELRVSFIEPLDKGGLALHARTEQVVEGREERTTTKRVRQGTRYWSPLFMPLGLVPLLLAPVSLIVDGPSQAWHEIKMGLPLLAGIFDEAQNPFSDYDMPEESDHVETSLTRKRLQDERPAPKTALEVTLSAQDARGERHERRLSLVTGGFGETTIPLGDFLAGLHDVPAALSVKAAVAGQPKSTTTREIAGVELRDLSGPIDRARASKRAESEGAAAEAAGQGATALEKFALAMRLAADASSAERLRAKAIAVALRMPRTPSLPLEAERASDRAQAILKRVQSPEDLARAAGELETAVATAPWWPNGYYNLGLISEKMGDKAAAARYFALYLHAAPSAPDARSIRKRLADIEVELGR